MCAQYEARKVDELQRQECDSFDARRNRGSVVLVDFEGLFAQKFKAEQSSVPSSGSMSEEKAFSILAPAILGLKSTSSLTHLITTSAGRLHLSLNTVEEKIGTNNNSSDYYTCKQFENFLLLCGFQWIPREQVPQLFAAMDTNHSGNLHVSEILFTARKAHELCRRILTRNLPDFRALAQTLVSCNRESTESFLTYQLSRFI